MYIAHYSTLVAVTIQWRSQCENLESVAYHLSKITIVTSVSFLPHFVQLQINALAASEENTRHKMGLPGR